MECSDPDYGIANHPRWISCDGGAEPCGMDVYMVPNDVIKGDDHPMCFITYGEVELLEAEAAVRGWHSGDRATHYANDVRIAIQYLAMFGDAAAITDADIDAYVAANPYDA